MTHLRNVLTFLQNSAVAPRLKTYAIFAGKMDYVVHVICPVHLKIVNITTAAMKKLKNLFNQ